MNTVTRRAAVQTILILIACHAPIRASDWTEPVHVRHDLKPCVSYRARLAGDFLLVQVNLEPGWHTFAMDNKQRANEKLAGKQPLGLDAPTEIKLAEGLAVIGKWRQTPPKDFSRPELQLFSWGFDEQALFAARVRRNGAGPARISIDGQACTETICKKVDVEISLPLPGAIKKGGGIESDLNSLVPVR